MNKKRLLYSLGSLATVAGSLTTLVACSRPKESKNNTMIKEFFEKSIPEALKKIEISIYDLENINLKDQINNFETTFGQVLPGLPELENNLDKTLGVFLTKKNEKQIELLFKLTFGINRPESAQEAKKTFNLNLKQLSNQEKEAKLLELITKHGIVDTYETSLKEKLVSAFPEKGTAISLGDLGVENHFKEIKNSDKNLEIVAEITKKILNENKIQVTLTFKKYGVTKTKVITITGFKNKDKSENEETLDAIESKIKTNEKKLQYDSEFVSLTTSSTINIGSFIDEITKQIVKENPTVVFNLKVTKKSENDLTIEIKLTKGSTTNDTKVDKTFTITMLKTQFKAV